MATWHRINLAGEYDFSDGTMPPVVFDWKALINFPLHALALANESPSEGFYGRPLPYETAKLPYNTFRPHSSLNGLTPDEVGKGSKERTNDRPILNL
ncbi:hypothetical protein [Spirosoma pulveris]